MDTWIYHKQFIHATYFHSNGGVHTAHISRDLLRTLPSDCECCKCCYHFMLYFPSPNGPLSSDQPAVAAGAETSADRSGCVPSDTTRHCLPPPSHRTGSVNTAGAWSGPRTAHQWQSAAAYQRHTPADGRWVTSVSRPPGTSETPTHQTRRQPIRVTRPPVPASHRHIRPAGGPSVSW